MRVGDWIKQWEYFMAKGETYGVSQCHSATVEWTVTLGLARAIRRLGDVLYNKYMDLVDDPEGIVNTLNRLKLL
jgi:hypothetical protein